tara:strand:+ start:10962 stop:11672 length:711 start_codon:yes stop_codon:yes gene_type:complete
MIIIKNCFWAFIPARSGSKKIKNKNLLKIKGTPLIAHSIRTANSIKTIKEVFFSSDSEEYLKVAKKYGCKNLVLRKKIFSGDKTSDFEVFKDFINTLIKQKKSLPEYIVHLRPTTPIRKSKIIEKAIKIFLKNDNYTSLRSVSLMTNPSYKTFRIKNGKLCSIFKEDYSLDKYNLPKENFEKTYLPNGYIDIIRTRNIQKNYIHGNKVYPFVIKEFNSDIDCEEDYINVKRNINDK